MYKLKTTANKNIVIRVPDKTQYEFLFRYSAVVDCDGIFLKNFYFVLQPKNQQRFPADRMLTSALLQAWVVAATLCGTDNTTNLELPKKLFKKSIQRLRILKAFFQTSYYY